MNQYLLIFMPPLLMASFVFALGVLVLERRSSTNLKNIGWVLGMALTIGFFGVVCTFAATSNMGS